MTAAIGHDGRALRRGAWTNRIAKARAKGFRETNTPHANCHTTTPNCTTSPLEQSACKFEWCDTTRCLVSASVVVMVAHLRSDQRDLTNPDVIVDCDLSAAAINKYFSDRHRVALLFFSCSGACGHVRNPK